MAGGGFASFSESEHTDGFFEGVVECKISCFDHFQKPFGLLLSCLP